MQRILRKLETFVVFVYIRPEQSAHKLKYILLTMQHFGFRVENTEFIESIATKYNMSTNGIKRIEHITDLKQLQTRYLNLVKQVQPKAKIFWNNLERSPVFEAFINEDLEIFGFAKVVVPSATGGDDEIVMQSFKLKDPLHNVQTLF